MSKDYIGKNRLKEILEYIKDYVSSFVKIVKKTQAEYDALPEEEQNDPKIIYEITDAEKSMDRASDVEYEDRHEIGATDVQNAIDALAITIPKNYISGGEQTSTSTEDGGSNVFTFTRSDGTTESFTVKNGSKGSTGPQGPKGDTGATPIITAEAGQNIGTVGTPSVGMVEEGGVKHFIFDYLKGAKGDKGDKGDTGAQGPKGDTGPQGPAGSTSYNADSVDGYHSGRVDTTNVMMVGERGVNVDTKSAGYFCGMSTTGTPNSNWWHVISMDWSGTGVTDWISQLALPTRQGGVPHYRRNNASGTAIGSSTWHPFITDENIGSQSVNYANSAGSASSAGNADTTDGYHVATGANANTIAARDSSGYLRCTYINCSRGTEAVNINYILYDNGDGWIRRADRANVYVGSAGNASISNYVKYQHTNEINFKGGRQNKCYFNYRNADDDNAGTGVACEYHFDSYGGDNYGSSKIFVGGISNSNGEVGPPINTNENKSYAVKSINISPGSHIVCYAHSNGTGYSLYFSGCDERIKKNITPNESGALDALNQIQLYSFDFKERYGGQHKELGFIAQQLKECIPEVVDKVDQPGNEEFDYLYQVDTFAMMPYLVRSIQELSKKVDYLEKRIGEL